MIALTITLWLALQLPVGILVGRMLQRPALEPVNAGRVDADLTYPTVISGFI